jgi:hypothetical protein
LVSSLPTERGERDTGFMGEAADPPPEGEKTLLSELVDGEGRRKRASNPEGVTMPEMIPRWHMDTAVKKMKEDCEAVTKGLETKLEAVIKSTGSPESMWKRRRMFWKILGALGGLNVLLLGLVVYLWTTRVSDDEVARMFHEHTMTIHPKTRVEISENEAKLESIEGMLRRLTDAGPTP